MLGGQLALHEDTGSSDVAVTTRNQCLTSSRHGFQAGRCGRQTSGSRRKQRFSSPLGLLTMALVLVVVQSEEAFLGSNVLELEDDHESLLSRAKDLLTEAVHDAANAVRPATKRWTNKKVHTLKITEVHLRRNRLWLHVNLNLIMRKACFTITLQYSCHWLDDDVPLQSHCSVMECLAEN